MQIDPIHVVQEGGSLGIVLGNDLLRAKIRAVGFFYPDSRVVRAVDLFESEALVDFYPLPYFRQGDNKLEVDFIGGAGRDNIKFYGNYLSVGEKIKNSGANEPFQVRLTRITAGVGLGLEYQLPIQYDFVHLFAEARVIVTPIQSNADRVIFKTTSIQDFASVSIRASLVDITTKQNDQ